MVKAYDDKQSRYVQGGLSSVDGITGTLTFWDRYDIPRSDDDVTVVIDPRYSASPWLISNDYYGNPSYLWVILQYNNLLSVDELVVDSTIVIPSPIRLRTGILIKSTGGKTE